jgi:hypothetical protein
VATRVRVQCINRTSHTDPHQRISDIGGVNGDGTRWRMTEAAAIRSIKANEFAFYVEAGGRRVDVIVAHRLSREYLKTVADGERPDNLLSLSECPR